MKALPILAAALVATAAAGAPAKPKAKPAGSAADGSERVYAAVPLDPSVDALPKGYAGHDCRTMSRALKALNPAKDEYETTAAYAERVAAFGAKPIAGSVTVADYVAFVPDYPLITTSYDADVGQFRISGSMGAIDGLVGSSLVLSVVTDSKVLTRSTYIAANAYGRKVEVRKTQLYACAVALPQLRQSYRSAAFDAIVSLSPDEAKVAKENVAILYVGKLAEPYWAKFFFNIEPKIDSPTETTWTGDALVIRDAEVWLFDKRTGRIYQKSKI